MLPDGCPGDVVWADGGDRRGVSMADINDRLQRLSRRDELTRRVLQHRVVPQEVASLGADFLDVVEAVANVVRRHPGMSIMVAPGDGRRGSAVVRVTELQGDAEVALVSSPPAGARGAASAAGEDPVVAAGPPGAGHAGQPAPVWRPPDRWPPPTAEPEYGRQQHERRWSG